MENRILVSVAVRAYQAEKYIAECLDGIIMQKKDGFDIEIVISTDCCTDNTLDIIKKYQIKYPNIIRNVTPEKNIGGFKTLFYVISECKGKYIALCDGDDYWTDENKLKKQIDFMENNETYSACFHNSAIKYEMETNRVYSEIVKDKDYFSNEIIRKWVIPTSSFFFCGKYKNDFPLKEGFYHDDIIVFLTMAEKGKIRGFSDEMSVYRKTSGSWTATMGVSVSIYDKIDLHLKTIEKKFEKVSNSTIILLRLKNKILKVRFKVKNKL